MTVGGRGSEGGCRAGLLAELGEIPAASAGMTERGRGYDGGCREGLLAELGEIPAASAGMTDLFLRGCDGWGAGVAVGGAGVTDR